jgi:hypothetical protein
MLLYARNRVGARAGALVAFVTATLTSSESSIEIPNVLVDTRGPTTRSAGSEVSAGTNTCFCAASTAGILGMDFAVRAVIHSGQQSIDFPMPAQSCELG